jgi:hypothetical protein
VGDHDIRIGLHIADGVGRGLYGGPLEWCLKSIVLSIVDEFFYDPGFLTGEVEKVLPL